ncbi:MAG: phosphate signaling complex protein PhoU [Clostridia bacterium]|nr:phosphate signaling complex protein PhoU [Deltaproteobacteria bacterium]
MTKHLERDLDHLKRELLSLGALVEDATNKAITALVHRRADLADEVRNGDDTIDAHELEIEEDCLKLLALHHPMATDLRFIVSVMKVNNDLERMGDLAVNIADRAFDMASAPPAVPPGDLLTMAERVRVMVRESLDSLVNRDCDLARKVVRDDEDVDAMHKRMFKLLEEQMMREPQSVALGIQTISASRHLERIADLATNIAEDVVFMVDGEVIRHTR